jgi:hypothetical protein
VIEMEALRRTSVALLVAVLALCVCGGLAAAKKRHKKRGYATQVTLAHPSENQFSGSVSSRLKGCRNQRLVAVYYTDPFTGRTQPVSVQRTNKFGKYHVDLTHPAYGGNYRAKAPKVSKRGTQLCRAGQSGVLTVPTVPQVP